LFPEYFENYYARIGREPGSYFALGRTDGTMLARFPAIDRDIRLDRNGPIGQLVAANPTAGLVTVMSPVDGIERRLGYRRLAEYPIYVGAGLETSAIRAALAVHHGPAFDLRRTGHRAAVCPAGAGLAPDAASLFRGR
jgi:hypothetical protein